MRTGPQSPPLLTPPIRVVSSSKGIGVSHDLSVNREVKGLRGSTTETGRRTGQPEVDRQEVKSMVNDSKRRVPIPRRNLGTLRGNKDTVQDGTRTTKGLGTE